MSRRSQSKGVPTLVKFFGATTARELVAQGKTADLLLGNNVLAQVPDLNDFVAGMKILLEPSGVITIEFPHLMRLMEENQFDTIYHEHFFYFSFLTAEKIFAAHGIDAFRRRGIAHARRIAADLRAPCGGQHQTRQRQRFTNSAIEGICRRVHSPRTVSDRFPIRSRRPSENCLDFLIQAQTRRQKGLPDTARPAKAIRC